MKRCLASVFRCLDWLEEGENGQIVYETLTYIVEDLEAAVLMVEEAGDA